MKPLMASMSVLCVAVWMAGCESKPKGTVWDLYDVRYPVPAGSTVPQSRATQYNRYIDNDEFYTPPTYGCAGNGYGLGGCE